MKSLGGISVAEFGAMMASVVRVPVRDPDELRSIPWTRCIDGTKTWCESVENYYRYCADSRALHDGLNVIAPFDIGDYNGRWLRMMAMSNHVNVRTPITAYRNCSNCGAPPVEGRTTCDHCGTPLKVDTATTKD